jgi:hypothetical protein
MQQVFVVNEVLWAVDENALSEAAVTEQRCGKLCGKWTKDLSPKIRAVLSERVVLQTNGS